jgi:methionyl-tRNA formyltransferase
MTDVPYGRGGSPLQNLILRGHKTTRLSALRMVKEADAGPVYCKHPLDLSGSAQTIYQRSTEQIWSIIGYIIQHQPEAIEQSGKVVSFARRKPAQSRIPKELELVKIYDYIRMLDAEGYPHAFMEADGYRLSFTEAKLENSQQLSATVVIELVKE